VECIIEILLILYFVIDTSHCPSYPGMFLVFGACNVNVFFCSGCMVDTYEIPRAIRTEDDIGMIMLSKVKDEFPDWDYL
jgi:hypothetical protein